MTSLVAHRSGNWAGEGGEGGEGGEVLTVGCKLLEMCGNVKATNWIGVRCDAM